eukprot:GHVU01130918.1.p1 GENE.GHVU01130918.1~~GHVU01130918.1.p1  ORF type:complete len:225 (+),score=10.78 GHVU01130918.1:70-744(+)
MSLAFLTPGRWLSKLARSWACVLSPQVLCLRLDPPPSCPSPDSSSAKRSHALTLPGCDGSGALSAGSSMPASEGAVSGYIVLRTATNDGEVGAPESHRQPSSNRSTNSKSAVGRRPSGRSTTRSNQSRARKHGLMLSDVCRYGRDLMGDNAKACDGVGTDWSLDLQQVNKITGDKALVAVGSYVLNGYLGTFLHAKRGVVTNFLEEIDSMYKRFNNPYHNATHG